MGTATRRWRVLVSAHYILPALPEYAALFEQHGIETVVPEPLSERLTEQELFRWTRDVDGVICGDDQFTEKVLRASPRLKVISKWGTGVDSIDRDAARRLGVEVLNTPGAFTDTVADTVMGYVLLWARQLMTMDRQMRDGQWRKVPAVALRECTIGIIGVGHIGKAVVQRAIAFGARVIGNDIVEIPSSFLKATGLTQVSRDELLAQADVVSLNCDLNPTSHHLMSGPEFRRMQRSAYLINTSRGPVVDELALIQALQERWIAGAALDVFEDEPLPADSPLRTFDNCLLAPHNANSSPSVARAIHENTIRNLIQGLEGVLTS